MRRNSANHSKSSAGSSDHHGDGVALGGEPGAAEVPAAEVGQGHDRPGARRLRRVHVFEPLVGHPRVELLDRQLGESEGLDPVAGVGIERPLDLAPQREGAQPTAVDPLQVSLNHVPALGVGAGQPEADGAPGQGRDRGRKQARHARSDLVRGDGRVVGDAHAVGA